MRLLRNNLSTLGPEIAWQVVSEFDHMLMESLEGQAMELGWIRDNTCDISEADYLRMTLKKTCWYSFIHPVPDWRPDRAPRPVPSRPLQRVWIFPGRRVPDPGRRPQPRRQQGALRQGDRRRPLRGQADADAGHLFEQSSPQERRKLHDLLGRPRSAGSRGKSTGSTSC